MTGFGAFLRKEVTEIRRTWRLWVIPGMLVFLGATSPVIAALTPALIKSVAASQPGVVMRMPTPRALDAYAQFIKNLDQFVLIAVVSAGAGVVSGERASGTAILALTKPLSRGAFVVAKILSQLGLLVLATALGTAACQGMTAVMFDGTDGGRLGPVAGHGQRPGGEGDGVRRAGGDGRGRHCRGNDRGSEDLRAPGVIAAAPLDSSALSRISRPVRVNSKGTQNAQK